jgi:hypothetical protein
MLLLIRFIGFLCGTVLTAFLYWSLWTETGPYAWLSALLSFLGNFGERLTFGLIFILGIVLLLVAAAALDRLFARLAPSDDKASAAGDSGLAYGIFAVPLVVLILSLKGTYDGIVHRTGASIPAAALAREAGWMPRNVRADPAVWAMDGGLAPIRYPSLTSATDEFFFPVDLRLADNPKNRRIFIRTDSATVAGYAADKAKLQQPVEGVLACEPLPARARRAMKQLGQDAPLFAVVLHHQRGVLGYWIGILLMHLAPVTAILVGRIYNSRRKKSAPAQNSASIDPVNKPGP